MKYCRARTYTSHTNPLQLHLLHGVLIYFDCIFVCVCVLVKEERHLCLTVYPPQTGDSFDSVSVLPAWHRRKKKKVFLIFRCWTELSRVYVTAALPPHT